MSTPKRHPLKRIRGLYQEYPSQFWVLVLGAFIDRLGGALLFPFFALYVTRKFGVGMTQVGVLFAIFSVSSIAGSMVGGALTDRFGRKGMLLFGLVVSALSSLLMGMINALEAFFLVTIFVGLMANAGGPAQQAMVADLLPEEKRAQGFGILRVAINLSFTIGPMIGGLLAAQSYLLLFVSDAVTSLATAGIVYVGLQETRIQPGEEEAETGILDTFGGYFKVMKDYAFVWFLIASALMVIVYMQMNTTLSVYLRDVHGVSEQYYGYLLSLNAFMVVVLQFPVSRWVSGFRPLLVMMAGTLMYAFGFGMYGLISIYPLFLVAIAIITFGEMLVAPVGQAIVARLSPDTMRGRYMAVYGFSWVIPSAVGPLLAGLVMDNADPRWVWYAAAIVGVIAALSFALLHRRMGQAGLATIHQRLNILSLLEEDEITAEEAADLLENIQDSQYARLELPEASKDLRYLRIRISDLATGVMKRDLRLPLGLVNTVLAIEGRLSTKLEGYDSDQLRELITRSATDSESQSMETNGNERVDISID